jgi:hypothetical protein
MESSDGHRTTFHVFDDDGVGTDPRVVTDDDGAQYLCASADIDVIADDRQPFMSATASERNLLKDKAINSNLSGWMDDDSVRMGDHEASTDVAIERYVGCCDSAPKSVAEHNPFSDYVGQDPGSLPPALVGADSQ